MKNLNLCESFFNYYALIFSKFYFKNFNYKIIGFGNNVNLYPNKSNHLKNIKEITKMINLIKISILDNTYFYNIFNDNTKYLFFSLNI